MRYLIAMRAASIAAWKQSRRAVARRRPGRGSRRSGRRAPSGGRSARASSACPVEGPARWTSTITIGSSSEIARPIVSALSTMPGPAEIVTPSAPPNDAPSAAPAAAISSSAWNVTTPKSLRAREILEDRGGRGDRVGAEEERQPGELRGGDQAVAERRVAGDLTVPAGRQLGAGAISYETAKSSDVSP